MEGPSIVILLEQVQKFKRKKILSVEGNTTTIDLKELQGKTIRNFESWGKHFLISFDRFYLRIHFLMFGSYNVDIPKDRPPRLALHFSNGVLYLYTCSIRRFEGATSDDYDWSSDLMSDDWSRTKTVNRIKKYPQAEVADILLDQEIFSGSGNIIKNEVLFRLLMHPRTKVRELSPQLLKRLATETRNYSFDFFNWKKEFTLKKHWLIYGKKTCKRCGGKIRKEPTGLLKRRSFYCPQCQMKGGVAQN